MMKNKGQDYQSICDELDRLSILMLDAMKEYVDCKVILENYIKTGSLHLAKARYIMGNKSVSSLQLPTEDCDIPAQTRVSHTTQKNGSSESLVFEISRLSMNEELNENGVKLRGTKLKGDGHNGDSGISNNKKASQNKTSGNKIMIDHENINSSDEKDISPKTLTMSKDPMKWFGILVPQNMKYAQANFSTALDYVIQCTNLQVEINSIRKKYIDLLKLKQSHLNKEGSVKD